MLFVRLEFSQAFMIDVHKDVVTQALEGVFDPQGLDQVVLADQNTDVKEYSLPEAHFDSETLPEGGARLATLLADAVQQSFEHNRNAALESFGRALHTLQDFYSHSTWAERNCLEAELQIHPDIYNIAKPDANFVCVKTPGPQGNRLAITTEYYPDRDTPEGKCSHGELNKDAANERTSPESMVECNDKILFDIAVSMAVQHTWEFYLDFEEMARTQHPDEADDIIHYFTKGGMTCATVPGSSTGMFLGFMLLLPLGLAWRVRR
jgi:hypothetical protein